MKTCCWLGRGDNAETVALIASALSQPVADLVLTYIDAKEISDMWSIPAVVNKNNYWSELHLVGLICIISSSVFTNKAVLND